MKELSHLDARGHARMVDVGQKPATERRAVAEVWVRLGPELAQALFEGRLPKGDALAVARVAGIAAAKRTSEIVPLCHNLPLSSVRVELEGAAGQPDLRVECEASTTAGTGVEMEALTGAMAAALTIYDMGKGIHKGIRIDGLRLLRKEGGASGPYVAPDSGAGGRG